MIRFGNSNVCHVSRSVAAAAAACLVVASPAGSGTVSFQTFSPAGLDRRGSFIVDASTSPSETFIGEVWSMGRGIDKVINLHSWGESVDGWIAEAEERVHYLGERPNGWKGEGSVPPAMGTVDDASVLLHRLAAEGCKFGPKIGAEDDGELIFFWRRGQAMISLSLGGDGRYSYFWQVEQRSDYGDDVLISDPVPVDILAAFDDLEGERA